MMIDDVQHKKNGHTNLIQDDSESEEIDLASPYSSNQERIN